MKPPPERACASATEPGSAPGLRDSTSRKWSSTRTSDPLCALRSWRATTRPATVAVTVAPPRRTSTVRPANAAGTE